MQAVLALVDDGASITLAWRSGAPYAASSELGVGPDGSIYAPDADDVLVRLDGATGAVLDTSGETIDFAHRFAVDADGNVFVSDSGTGSTSMLRAFTADLAPLWSVELPLINLGGPAIGTDGTLVVAGAGTIHAWR